MPRKCSRRSPPATMSAAHPHQCLSQDLSSARCGRCTGTMRRYEHPKDPSLLKQLLVSPFLSFPAFLSFPSGVAAVRGQRGDALRPVLLDPGLFRPAAVPQPGGDPSICQSPTFVGASSWQMRIIPLAESIHLDSGESAAQAAAAHGACWRATTRSLHGIS